MYPSIENQYQKLGLEERKIYDHLRFSERIDGWLLLEEAIELYRLVATTVSRPAVFCEIGTWMGKSASIMGAAALDRGDARVYGVDPFTGIGDAASTAEYEQRRQQLFNISQQEQCQKNIDDAGVRSVVRLLPLESRIARNKFNESHLDGLFIDGDHSFEHVHEDVDLWSPLLRSGAWLVLHDVGAVHVDGPRRMMEELKKDQDHWMDWRIVGEMAIVRRR